MVFFVVVVVNVFLRAGVGGWGLKKRGEKPGRENIQKQMRAL